ncbi:MAG: formate/nitrite transporter family protein, partial [Bacillota bacterium]
MRILLRGVLAGLMVSLGCVAYLMCPNKIVGSFLFSFGLFTILNLRLALFTGRVGYLAVDCSRKSLIKLLLALAGNLLGTLFSALLIRGTRLQIMDAARAAATIRLEDGLVSLFILAFFCGILMFLAVELSKTLDNAFAKALSVVFAVMLFINAGFEHCIADMFFLALAGSFAPLRLSVIILGNTAGSILFCFCYKATAPLLL